MAATMTPLGLVVALLGGTLIGGLYFGGLWWTIGRMTTARAPGLLVLGSFLLRTLTAAAGFVLIGGGSWVRLVVALAGFILARVVLARRWGPKGRNNAARGAV